MRTVYVVILRTALLDEKYVTVKATKEEAEAFVKEKFGAEIGIPTADRKTTYFSSQPYTCWWDTISILEEHL